MLDLSKIREELDELDTQFTQLLEKRLELCKDVAEYKIETGKPVLDREREKEKIARAEEQVQGDFNKQCARALFVQMMSMSRRLQYSLAAKSGLGMKLPFTEVEELSKENCRVVYQGLEGAHTQAAMWQYFGEEVECYHVKHWNDVMKDIADGKADYGVLPIENSTAGSVIDIYDLLVEYDNTIVAEQILPIRHALLALPGTKIEDIQNVYSHPQALMQSAGYLNAHCWQQHEMLNTAIAAQKIVEDGDKTQAAVAGSYAAKVHNLEVLADEINDQSVNSTRFIVVTKKKIYRKHASKVSICFELPHEKGTLYNILANIIYNDLNMTKIESRPLGDRNWEYRFFIDFEGNLNEDAVKNALTAIDSEAINLKILGNY
ncbi:MAG: prephenate dehydratase [Lachnospiraceae bacterium]|nr:prephenate dehydratase [Lachnospiraceae bacterium]